MAEKKNQRYPEFCLKLFSENKKTIDLFNIRLSEPKLNVSIKDQFSKPYFYGKDLQQDKAFEKLEGVVAKTVALILKSEKLPKKDSKEYVKLLFYMVSQGSRTKHKGEEYNEQTNKTLRASSRDDRDLSSALENWRVVSKNPTAVPLSAVAALWFVPYDLDAKIICDRSRELFIVSDNPVVC